ncbi:MAG: gluconokinase [Aestuariivirga sp.]
MSTAESLQSFNGAVVVMGVSACGKTTVGEALAAKLYVQFVEGDKLHPPTNVAKMSAGHPLTDEDRWPWLAQVGVSLKGEKGIIASCSALKKIYRQRIIESAGRPVSFILLNGDKAILQKRIAARKGHFMPPSLLDSQLATLEIPGPDEHSITIDIALPLEAQVAQAVAFLLK